MLSIIHGEATVAMPLDPPVTRHYLPEAMISLPQNVSFGLERSEISDARPGQQFGYPAPQAAPDDGPRNSTNSLPFPRTRRNWDFRGDGPGRAGSASVSVPTKVGGPRKRILCLWLP
jgi:hypothetical protein